ncbi:MAG: hypothetical protein ACRC2S_07690 [Waterburya sp.]
MDNDLIFLKQASSALFAIDVKYKMSGFNEKKKLVKARDAAFSAYALERLELLEEGVKCSQQDIDEMKEIRRQIEEAAETQTLIQGVVRLTSFLINL